jgi:hypothetical protein
MKKKQLHFMESLLLGARRCGRPLRPMNYFLMVMMAGTDGDLLRIHFMMVKN